MKSSRLRVFKFADGRIDKHAVPDGRKWWQLHEGLPRIIRRMFQRREFAEGDTRWVEYHEEVAR